ncbi:MAG: DUF192 domain-containing protein [Castellaniella sp.]|uniref:DUF192 domain-containing protein n=1 Tax=Castellaniella sp. TaxID=1955812 RepID=UPI001222C9D3|nr:DUF192 domain-containing protein [Castellaniella sp.]TAN27784.1 MAG: DUF192 domain-containing protein [Castellaniella sp.]
MLLPGLPAAAQPPLAMVSLEVGEHTVHAELADTPDRMREGLMGRTHLAADSGMLFMLGPPDDLYCFWMKNTLLPLSIAFIDEHGRIVSIQDMQPLSLAPHCPPSAITTALEMDQGWFARSGIGVGAAVRGIPPLPAARRPN